MHQVEPPTTRIRIYLDLSDTNLTDDDLSKLKLPANLTSLNVARTRITDAGVTGLLRVKKLVSLDLMGTQVADAGCEHLESIPGLRCVNLNGTKISPQTRLDLEKFLNKRQELSVKTS